MDATTFGRIVEAAVLAVIAVTAIAYYFLDRGNRP